MKFIYVDEEDAGAFIFTSDEFEGMQNILEAIFGKKEAEETMREFHKQRNRVYALKQLDEETIN